MKTLILTIVYSLVCFSGLWASDCNRPQSADYVKGVEALNSGDAELAYKLLNSELTAHPENGYAHCYMALVCNYYGDTKLAFYAANESLKLIPQSDEEYRSFAYYTRGTLYMNAKSYVKAEQDLNEAIRLLPSDADNYKTRAEAYLNEGKYQEALSDLQTVIKLDAKADVYDLMMKLIQANPDPAFFDQVTASVRPSTAMND